MRVWMIAAAGFLSLAAQPPGDSLQLPIPDTTPETLRYRADAAERMTVPVTVDGRGPYRFVVDTGSERTVISREVADSLGLSASGNVMLASITDVRSVPTVMIGQLGMGRRSLRELKAPILAEQHLGAHGLLGIDSLQNLRVDLDFERGQMHLSRLRLAPGRPSDGSMQVRGGDGTIVVRGTTLLGRLILTDASVDGERVRVIVDTGSAITIGNPALQRRLAGRDPSRRSRLIGLTSVTGGSLELDYSRTSHVRLGGAHVMNMPIGFADVQLFRELGLDDRPAILLGMDALQLFRQVSIDFATRRLRLVPRPLGSLMPSYRFTERTRSGRPLQPRSR